MLIKHNEIKMGMNTNCKIIWISLNGNECDVKINMIMEYGLGIGIAKEIEIGTWLGNEIKTWE